MIEIVECSKMKIKLDYKPKQIDYKTLSRGQYFELLNLFHLENSSVDLPASIVRGTSLAQLPLKLIHSWIPFVRSSQLPNVVSGITPVRTIVNLGGGIADLVLLPFYHFQTDGEVLKGIKKGASSFAKSATMESLRLGTKLAMGAQIILEQAEDLIGGSQECTQGPSKFSNAPENFHEGVQSAITTLGSNMNKAAQTIFAVPMETYETDGAKGCVKAVIRAVPIALIKPMIGASEAISKTFIGMQSTIDPKKKIELRDKYKQNK